MKPLRRSALQPTIAQLDKEFVWHPFTQMRDWMRGDPLVIREGKGARLVDDHGREYLDANASIWTCLHGHRHPAIDAAIRRQLKRIAHSSFLGLTHEPAALLARDVVRLANPEEPAKPHPPETNLANRSAALRGPRLTRVFYSDNGSTALEVSLKLAWEFTRRTRGVRTPRFLSLQGAYHGDTIGAVALGHIDLFHSAYGGMLFPTDSVMAPYCYRCPFNRARPERADARAYRVCRWECVDQVERAFTQARRQRRPYSAFAFEPGMQGAAGMIPQPDGWLARTAEIARSHETLLIADEVMTGLGRTGGAAGAGDGNCHFACHREQVQPDFLNLAKGLSGGYLPLAATLTSSAVFEAFLGEYEEFKTFFHGHSFTANPLGCAAALASLKILESSRSKTQRLTLERTLASELGKLWRLPGVGDVRQVGLVAGVELVRDWQQRTPFPREQRIGARVCEAMRRRGVLTRPIGDVVVIMPPYCTTVRQVRRMVEALGEAIEEVLENRRADPVS